MPGLDTLTIQDGSSNNQPFQYDISEFSNCSGMTAGTSSSAGLTPNGSALISATGFTPTNYNSQGGNIIWNYVAPAKAMAGGATAVTTWTAGTNFKLLDADIMWGTSGGTNAFYEASQWYTQATSAALTPTITSTGDTTDTFNSVTVAIKAADRGGSVPSGIYIRSLYHNSTTAIPTGAGTLSLQAPMTGNLRVVEFPYTNWAGGFTSVTDSDSNTYTCPGTNEQFCYAIDATHVPSPTNKITFTWASSQGEGFSAHVFDVNNATAYDTDTAASPTGNCVSVSGINNDPAITPTHAPGLVIAYVPLSIGPGYGVIFPPGAIWDLILYNGQTDASSFDNSDLVAHLYNTTTAAENWAWFMSSQAGNGCGGEAIAFH